MTFSPRPPSRLTVRDINAALSDLDRQREAGTLSPDAHALQRGHLIDGMASAHGMQTLIDDALTEQLPPLPPSLTQRRTVRPTRHRRTGGRRILGWMALAVLITGLTMTVATLLDGRWA
jgi:hypothetical protein